MSKEETRELESTISMIARMIPKERQSRDVYRQLAAKAKLNLTKVLFERLADQEQEHENKMQAAIQLLQEALKEAKSKPKPSD